MIAEDAVSCVALGTGKALDNLDTIDRKNKNKKSTFEVDFFCLRTSYFYVIIKKVL